MVERGLYALLVHDNERRQAPTVQLACLAGPTKGALIPLDAASTAQLCEALTHAKPLDVDAGAQAADAIEALNLPALPSTIVLLLVNS
jgi:hypothetical protein